MGARLGGWALDPGVVASCLCTYAIPRHKEGEDLEDRDRSGSPECPASCTWVSVEPAPIQDQLQNAQGPVLNEHAGLLVQNVLKKFLMTTTEH